MAAKEDARARLAREYREALRTQSADRLAGLYQQDACHELPFLFPGMPSRLEGRERIRQTYAAIWLASDAQPEYVRDVATHYADDGETVTMEQVVVGALRSSGRRFEFPGVVVMRVRNGAIVHVRDYMDGLAVAQALGRLPEVAAALDRTT